jgi:hypothetical protein
MMNGAAANGGAAQYTVRYSNFTVYDKLLNLTHEINNAVTLILHFPFHLKGKMLCCIGYLNGTVFWLQQKPGI